MWVIVIAVLVKAMNFYFAHTNHWFVGSRRCPQFQLSDPSASVRSSLCTPASYKFIANQLMENICANVEAFESMVSPAEIWRTKKRTKNWEWREPHSSTRVALCICTNNFQYFKVLQAFRRVPVRLPLLLFTVFLASFCLSSHKYFELISSFWWVGLEHEGRKY